MLKNVITVANEDLEEFEQYLYERENARATIRKYMTDIRTFCKYLGKRRKRQIRTGYFYIKSGCWNTTLSAVQTLCWQP